MTCCNACLNIAKRRSVVLGMEVSLREGHRGTVEAINHDDSGVTALVVDTTLLESVVLPLSALP